ncbi:ATP-dependent Clp protease proteolytic subunit [Patescibacteria group bacterium]|nr:ATP-dependent Clp protease proteolytic subunit [Patescibacteria group bacterium]
MFIEKQTIRILGGINGDTIRGFEDRLAVVLSESDAELPIDIYITSGGGSTAMARVFFDIVRSIDHRIRTIGVGRVFSSAVLMLQAGDERLITPHTLMLIHPITWTSPDKGISYSMEELEMGDKERKYEDVFYNETLASRSHLSLKQVNEMKKGQTLLYPDDIIKHGLADAIIKQRPFESISS